MQKVELRHWWEYGDEKTGMNELYEKRHERHFLRSPGPRPIVCFLFPLLNPAIYLFNYFRQTSSR